MSFTRQYISLFLFSPSLLGKCVKRWPMIDFGSDWGAICGGVVVGGDGYLLCDCSRIGFRRVCNDGGKIDWSMHERTHAHVSACLLIELSFTLRWKHQSAWSTENWPHWIEICGNKNYYIGIALCSSNWWAIDNKEKKTISSCRNCQPTDGRTD